MHTTTPASAEFFVRWRSGNATHRDWHYFPKLNPWRDFMPGDLGERLQDESGGLVEVPIAPGDAIPVSESAHHCELSGATVQQAFQRRRLHGPFSGRFYPRGVLAPVNGAGTVYSQELEPFRVLSVDADRVAVDLGHPLAGYPLTVGGRIGERLGVKEERGGSCHDIVADITAGGPGMQCPLPTGGVDYGQADNFAREDTADDEVFYAQPRMVQHIDSQARQFINRVYRRVVQPGDRVLDLMSSWVSHLDGVPSSVTTTGLGMNRAELAANPELHDYIVHDLNRTPRLPWENAEFDVAVCTVSVEYLTQPYQVFAEVARVLRPGGRFVVTFSDRWFPPKAIRLWSRLHPFERMGLVLDYFRCSETFTALGTESWVGWPRPEDDKYYGRLLDSDPVFAVWGERSGENSR